MFRKMIRFAAPALAALALAGCTNVASFVYSDAQEPFVSFGGPEAKSVAVLPFLDARNGADESGSFYLGMLPLMPYGYLKKPFPDRSDDFVSLGRYHFNPPEDLAEAATQSLKASKLFGQVVFVRSAAGSDAEYLWRGTLYDSAYTGAMLTYGVTYFLAPGLWIVGFPEGISRNTLSVRFELVERSTGKVVWAYNSFETDSLAHWIYARIGQDASLYPELMRRAMNRALIDLSGKLPALR